MERVSRKRARRESGQQTARIYPQLTAMLLSFFHVSLKALSERSDVFRSVLQSCEGDDWQAFMALHDDLFSTWIRYALAPAADAFQDREALQRIGCALASRMFAAHCYIPGTEFTGDGHALDAVMEQQLPPDLIMRLLGSDLMFLKVAIQFFFQYTSHAFMARLSVMACMPSLAAMCTTDGSTPSRSRQPGPIVTLAMQWLHVPVSVPECQAGSFTDLSNEDLWIHMSLKDVIAVVPEQQFSLQKSSNTLGCALRLRSFNIQEHHIPLQQSHCLVFGDASGSMTLTNVTFTGGTVMCTGNCNISFNSCTFHACTLVVKGGAVVTMKDTASKDIHLGSGLGVLVTGSGSTCTVQNCRFERGIQAVAVLQGACFTACELDIVGVNTLAIEAANKGTRLDLYLCTISAFRDTGTGILTCAVAVRDNASSLLTCVGIYGNPDCGVEAYGCATLRMYGCLVDGAREVAVNCYDDAVSLLEGCSFANATHHWMFLIEYDYASEVVGCEVLNNGKGPEHGTTVKRGILIQPGHLMVDLNMDLTTPLLLTDGEPEGLDVLA